MSDEREMAEEQIDWDAVRADVAAKAHLIDEQILTARPGWIDDVMQDIRDAVACSPHRNTVADYDIDEAMTRQRLLQYSFWVLLGNRTTGQEMMFPHPVLATGEEEASLTALQRFRDEEQFDGLRGGDPSAWAVYDVS